MKKKIYLYTHVKLFFFLRGQELGCNKQGASVCTEDSVVPRRRRKIEAGGTVLADGHQQSCQCKMGALVRIAYGELFYALLSRITPCITSNTTAVAEKSLSCCLNFVSCTKPRRHRYLEPGKTNGRYMLVPSALFDKWSAS